VQRLALHFALNKTLTSTALPFPPLVQKAAALMPESAPLPAVIAGPLLRRLEPQRLVLWLVASRELALTLRLMPSAQKALDIDLDATRCQVIPVGRNAFIHLIDVALDSALPQDITIGYDLLIDNAGIAQWAPHLVYGSGQTPNFVLHSRIHQLVHGSCRKPHHSADEGLLCVDRLLAPITEAGSGSVQEQ